MKTLALVLVSTAAGARAQEFLRVARGDSAGERFGRTVTGGGDVDGDGRPDLLLGAYADSDTAPEQGSVRVVSGWTGAELYAVYGSGKDWLGYSLAFVGDVDGDGRADFVAGATQATLGGNPPGYARLFSGATGAVLRTVTGPLAYSDFGCSVAGVGDVDGDAVPDFAVGARFAGTAFGLEDSGAAYVYSGATGAVLRSWTGTISFGSQWLGWAIAAAGDVDGDGCGDLAISSPGWDEGGLNNRGAVEVRSICTGALIRRTLGIAANESAGISVASGGDVDGDGMFDVLVGVPGGTFDGVAISGGVRAYSGATGLLLRSFGGGTTSSFAGESCAIVGDTDGDGFADVAIGSPGQPPGWTCGGRAELYSGATGLSLRSICGEALEDDLGRSVSGAGDVNGDGYADWIVGAPHNDAFATNAGAAYVVSGFACAGPTTYCVALPNSVGAGAHIGSSGSTSLAWNQLRLTCDGLPPNNNGRFFFGTAQTQVLFGDGYRCVAGSTWRLPIGAATPQGTVAFDLDVLALPNGAVLAPGATRHFQYWYRNVLPGGSGFNLSDGLTVTFCP